MILNMRKVKMSVLAAFALMPLAATAQNTATADVEKRGSAIVTVYANAYSGFGSVNGERGFELKRAYLGYQYKLTEELLIRAVADFGQSKQVTDNQRIGYIKHAMVTWTHGRLTLNAGLIPTIQFKVQEDFWGNKYVMNSFQDEYKFGSSADLAVSAAYQFNRWLAADAIVANGEGYRKLQIGDGMQYGAGVTITPVDGLTLRAYGSYNESVADGEKGITNIAAFAGYRHKRIAVGAEYNRQINTGHEAGRNLDGVSVYSTVALSRRVELLLRYDRLMAGGDDDKSTDGSTVLAGASITLCKGVKIAPNFKMWSPTHGGTPNTYYGNLTASFSL